MPARRRRGGRLLRGRPDGRRLPRLVTIARRPVRLGGIRWLGGCEERVRFCLGLLVFVLAAANAANFLLMRSIWTSLRDAVEEGVDARGASVAAELMRDRS